MVKQYAASGIRVAVAELRPGDDVSTAPGVCDTQWRELTPLPPKGVETVRVEASDLREAQRLCAQIRADATLDGCSPSVMLDIAVVVDIDAPAARRRLAAASDFKSNTVGFVGTASGLAGLIADVYVLGIADGVALIPLAGQRAMSDAFDLVVQLLDAKGPLQPRATTPVRAAGGFSAGPRAVGAATT